MHPGDHGFAVAKFSAFEDHPAEQKQTEIPNLLLQEHFVGKKPAMRMKRPAAVLEADKSSASEAAQGILKKVQAQEERKNVTTLNLQQQLHLLTWATAS